VLKTIRQPIYPPNQKHLQIKKVGEDYESAIIPDQIIEFYHNALLTPTNHIFVKGRYVPAGLLTTYDDKKLRFHKQVYLYVKSRFVTKNYFHNGVFLFAHDSWSNNYYHWLCETLPRFLKMHKEYPDAIVIIPEIFRKYAFVAFSLQLLGLKHEWCDTRFSHRFYKLVTIQTSPRLANVNPMLQRNLKTDLFKSLRVSINSFSSRKVYISRSKASARSIENEAEIIPLLLQKGYEIVHCETLSFEQQLTLFSQAKAVIGLHGAGLTNIMFMTGGKLLEIRNGSSWEINPFCFWRLANVMDVSWSYHQALPCGEPSNFNNVIVDLDQFRKDLENFEQIA
jgi:capsular polysaccharide biosynthesis protein